MTRTPRLADEAPGTLRLPFLPLSSVPTPVEPMVDPQRKLRGGLYQKRDDVISDLYGGNKVRRFEWLLAAAQARGVRSLVTVGGYASTQVTATILHGGALGFDVHAVLFEQPRSSYLREALTTGYARGGRFVLAHGYGRSALHAARLMATLPHAMFIWPGASTPLANLGYVEAVLELREQVDAGFAPRPDRILVPTGSGGTAVGLAIGCALVGWPTVVTAVRISEPVVTNRWTLEGLTIATRRTLTRLGLPSSRARDVRLEVDGRFLGGGYGHATPEADAGAALYEEILGVPGEPTYSGKGMAALAQWAEDRPRETILYWHTLSSTGRRPREGAPLPDALRRLASLPSRVK